jgi:hypothetical protein
MRLTGIENLHREMREVDELRQQFRFEYNGVDARVLFLILLLFSDYSKSLKSIRLWVYDLMIGCRFFAMVPMDSTLAEP